MVRRFCTICDRCGARSEEYTAWPTCDVCLEDICPACTARIVREADLDTPPLVCCHHCAADGEAV